jgi:hypothetical protein
MKRRASKTTRGVAFDEVVDDGTIVVKKEHTQTQSEDGEGKRHERRSGEDTSDKKQSKTVQKQEVQGFRSQGGPHETATRAPITQDQRIQRLRRDRFSLVAV